MKLDSRVADGFTGVWSAPISRASRAAFPWAPFLLYPGFATSLTLRGIARDKKRGILKMAISRLHSGGGFRIILSVFLTEGWPSG